MIPGESLGFKKAQISVGLDFLSPMNIRSWPGCLLAEASQSSPLRVKAPLFGHLGPLRSINLKATNIKSLAAYYFEDTFLVSEKVVQLSSMAFWRNPSLRLTNSDRTRYAFRPERDFPQWRNVDFRSA